MKSSTKEKAGKTAPASEAPFQKIPDASRITGLSQYFLRRGCRAGTIPHIKSGPVYYIDVPALLRQLENGQG